jgi:hypothetical protein
VAGYRNYSSGSLDYVGTRGGYWSSTVLGADASRLSFDSSTANVLYGYRAFGFSVRCLKD